MARQTSKSRRQEREREIEQPRPSLRRTSGPKEAATRYVQELSSVQRPARVNKDAQTLKPSKAKQTVSAAGIFKKKLKANTRDKKHHRRREPTPEPDLMSDLRDGFDHARDTMNANAKATFDEVHAALSERLAASKSMDETFFQQVIKLGNTLSAPLVQEEIETTIIKNGKRKVEVVLIGNRVAIFKKNIEKEDAKLKEQWKQWDAIQNEYLELGMEVFGPEVFGEAASGHKLKGKGFKKEMDLLNLEHETRVEEFDEEIEEIGSKMLQKMRSSEKELEAAHKQEQKRLLEQLIHGD